jgi:hypothetical protein
MPNTSETLRLHPLLRILMPIACVPLCVPMTAAYLRGEPDPIANIVALCSIAVGVAWWVASGRFAFTIDDEGPRRSTPFGERALRWDEIVEYRYAAPNSAQTAHLQGALVAAAAASLNGGTLTLRGAGGRRLPIGSGWRGAADAIARIAERLDGPKRQQLAPALRDGSPVTFGRITVQRDGLVCGEKELLPWSDIASAQVHFGRLAVNRSGRRRPHFVVRTKALPHFFLLLQLLAERGVQVARD